MLLTGDLYPVVQNLNNRLDNLKYSPDTLLNVGNPTKANTSVPARRDILR